jgi:hypothetical protein
MIDQVYVNTDSYEAAKAAAAAAVPAESFNGVLIPIDGTTAFLAVLFTAVMGVVAFQFVARKLMTGTSKV